MKAESGIRPQLFNVDKVGENAVISLFNNIREVATQEDEVGIIFEYDYYSIEIPYRDGLELDVEYNFEKWLSLAIAKEGICQERTIYAPVTPKPSETEILEAKLKASTDRQDFLEELIVEMAMIIYE